ncbi:hypothetical protein K1W54_00920 [Micromonospora sp. CPCC 205371]|nr:hypothetical protein [Micromonospora sp. CPCC 205371]
MTSLEVELAAAASQRWWNRWTVYLVGAALVLGGFIGGIEMQKAYGSSTSPTASGPQGQRGGYGGFPGGGAVPSTAASRPTTGTVKLVDGTTIYVQTESGEVVTVRTNGETAVAVAAALKDLKAGDKVTVQGQTDSEGTVTATTVTGSK